MSKSIFKYSTESSKKYIISFFHLLIYNITKMMDLLQEVDTGNIVKIEYLVKKYGLPKDSAWSDYILLRYALWRSQADIAKFLIEQGCRLNKTTKSSTNTPLHIVVKHEDEDLIKILLDKGALIEAKNKAGETPLHFAAKTKNDKVIDLLLTKISSTDNESSVNKSGLVPLHIACMRNDLSLVEKLLSCGAPINKHVTLDSAFWPSYTPLHLAVEFERLEIVYKLLSVGADISAKNSKGMTALHLAVQLNYLPIVDLILEAHERCSESINPTDNRGISHFHVACTRKDSRVVGGFLRRGIEINCQVNEDSDMWPRYTPLHFAVENTCVEIVELLLCYGADISQKNAGGLTPLHFAIQRENKQIIDLILSTHGTSSKIVNPVDDRGFSHFHAACMRNDTGVVRAFLDSGVQVNVPVHTTSTNWPLYTPLHFAVENKCPDTARLLLERGAVVNATDVKGTTPLHMSAHNMDEEIARILLASGADVNARTTTDMTPLHMATDRGHLELVELLLQHKADVNCAEVLKLNTPLHLATLGKHFKIIEVLLREGADANARARDGKTALHTMTHRDSKRVIDMELVEAYNKIITSLVGAGCSIDALDSHGRTPLHMTCIYRSPSGAYALLQNGADINVEDNVEKTPACYFCPSINYIFRKHIQKLRVLNFPVSNDNRSFYLGLRAADRQCKRKWKDVEPDDQTLDEFTQSCLDELDRMRAVRVDCYSSLYSIIFKNQNELALHVLNESLKELVHSEEFDTSFPLYGYLIRLQFKKGMARMVLMRPAKDMLETLARQGLPDSCSESILQYLSNEELKNLISAKTGQSTS